MTAPETVQETETLNAPQNPDEASLDGTLIELYRQAAPLYEGGRDFLVAKRGGQWVGEPFDVVDQRIKNIAAALVESGIKAGDRVAIMSRNRPEWALADLAILHVGAVSVPIYDTLDPEKTGYIVKDAGVKVAFAEDESIVETLLAGKTQAKAREMKRIVVFDDPVGTSDESVTPLVDFEAEGAKAPQKTHQSVTKRADAVKNEDLASIVYTSGTTGMPKGVMLTHNNFHSNVVASLRAVPMQQGITCLSFLPLSHVFERVAGYYIMVAVGATIAYAESVPAVPQNLGEVKPDVMASVPRLYEKMYAKVNQNVEQSSWLKKKIFNWALDVGGQVAELKVNGKPVPPKLQKKLEKADRLVFSKIKGRTGGRLQFFISGGAPLSKTVEVYFAALGIDIFQGYGLTETSPVVSVNTPTRRRFGSVGPVVDGVEVKIADDGEICVRGKNVMKGYWNKPDATAEVIDDEGWFHTGDIGRFDDEGYLYVTDRKKELIVMSNGKNVAPQPIENDLKTQPHIAQAVVIGDNRNYMTALIAPDFEALAVVAKEKKLGTEDPVALVQTKAVQDLVRQEVEAVNARLSRYEQIKKFRILPRELTQEAGELTPTLKTKRRVIDQAYEALIEEMYGGQDKKGD